MKHQQGLKLEGNVVLEKKYGNTTIKFCDDYVARTPEEIEKVLYDFHQAGWEIIEDMQDELIKQQLLVDREVVANEDY